jgi:phospholipid transport system substrate-binding protein
MAPSAWAQSGNDAATSFIVNLGNAMVEIVNAPGTLEEKKRRIQPLIDGAVDIPGLAQFCLGRYWRVANAQQQARFVDMFHQVLVNNIAGKIGEYQGVSFSPTTTTQREGMFLVGTLIRRPNQQPNNVQWVVSTASGQPKIEDVVAEGTSLRVTQRSDYMAYLQRNNGNIEALLGAMQRMVGA